VGGLCAAALTSAGHASAATITQSSVPDFQTGKFSGAVTLLQKPDSPATGIMPGMVGVMPQLGASIISDDFNYTTKTAFEAAGWNYSTPNASLTQALVDNPSSYSFPGNGALRLHVSRPQDFWNTAFPGQDTPLLVMNTHELTGDFIAETKLDIQSARTNPTRTHGIIVMQPTPDGLGGQVIDFNTNYLVAATQLEGDLVTWPRWAPDFWPLQAGAGFYPSNTMWVRVVRQGQYFSSYFKTTEAGPWVFLSSMVMDALKSDELFPVIVGIVEKSWAAGDQYQDTDYDYFKVNEIGATHSGTYTNVIDAGLPADWQTMGLVTQSMTGTKFQARAGNTVADGTVTDGGAFVGPDGTAATFFEGDTAEVLSASTRGKRYLEYKLSLDSLTTSLPGQTAFNLPAVVKSVSASWQPAGLSTNFLTTKADFGADTTDLAVQSGDGDLALKRTQIFRDDFNADPLSNGWTLSSGTGAGTVDATSRTGWARMGVPYNEDIFIGTNDTGGVRLFRPAPAQADYEIETEINLETQNSRQAGLYLWQDKDNFVGITVTRRDQGAREIGILDDFVINDGGLAPDPIYRDYGSNHVFLRMTRRGQIVTLSFRDADSPTWRVHRVFNLAGKATGGLDFVPTQVGLMAKSYGAASRATENVDFNYFQTSTLPAVGAKDLALPVPAGASLDTLVPLADDGLAINYQIKNAGGTFVGPDGTAGSMFSPDEPKIPAALNGQTTLTVRSTFSNTTNNGTPYLHALGVQYANGSTKVARDTNAADFTAGINKSGVSLTTRPGTVLQEGIGEGAAQLENFTTTPADWLWSNTPPGNSTYSFTEKAGSARLNVGTPSDTWGDGTAITKPRAFLYKATPVSGDFVIETHIDMPNGRTTNRHQGIAVIQARDGATPDLNLDMTNLVNFGPYTLDNINYLAILHADNNGFGDGPHIAGYTENSYYLRLQKIGRTFTGFASTDGTTWTEVTSFTFGHDLPSMYVGFFSKSWPGSSGIETSDFDYFRYAPLQTSGTFESRVLDIGAAGLAPILTQNGNSAGLQIQIRAADTSAGVASATYAGPDGTAATFYSGSSNGLLAALNGKRYFQYKALLPSGTLLNDIAFIGASGLTLPLGPVDVQNALKIAGGISAATGADKDRLDSNADGKVDLLDAAKILRGVNGL
jgi:hypothetical protein